MFSITKFKDSLFCFIVANLSLRFLGLIKGDTTFINFLSDLQVFIYLSFFPLLICFQVTTVGTNTEWGMLMASISEDTGEETPLQVRCLSEMDLLE